MKRKLFAILMSLTLVLTYIPAMAFADTEASERWGGTETKGSISVGDSQDVNVENAYDYANFEFKPEASGTYCFTATGDYDTFGRVLGDGDVMYDDDDEGEGNNFKVIFDADEGSVYQLQAAMYDSETGSFTVSLTNYEETPDDPVDPDNPDDPVEEDDWWIYFDYDREDEYILPASGSGTLQITAEFENQRKNLTYQWYKGTRKADGSYDFAPLTGKTSTSLPVNEAGRYMCEATNTATGYKKGAEIDVRSWYVDESTYDADTTFHPGSPLELQVILGGKYTAANMKYDWYKVKGYSSDGVPDYEVLAENSTSKYTIPGSYEFSDEIDIYCVAKELKGSEVLAEDSVTFTVNKGNEWWVNNKEKDINLPDTGSYTIKVELAGKFTASKMTFQWGTYAYDEAEDDWVIKDLQGQTKQSLTISKEGDYVCKVVNTETNTKETVYFYAYYPTYGLWYNKVYYERLGHTVAEGAIATYNQIEYNGSFAFPASVRLKDGKTYPLTRILAWQVHVDDGVYLGKNCKTVTVPASVKEIDKYALGYYMDEKNDYAWTKIPGFTIIGTTGSAAQRYAAANGFAFRDPGAEALKRNGVADSKIPKVKIKKPAAKKNAVTVKWTKLNKKQLKKSKATKYEVWVSTSKSFPAGATTKEVFKSKGKSSAKISGLKKKTKYFVKVRAIKYVGGVKHVGKWSSVKSVKTKK